MSRSKAKRKAPKYQRAKLACLPFLLAILGYVLLAGSESEDETPAAARAATLTASASRQRPAATAGIGRTEAQQAKLPDWSELASRARTKCNPFLPIAKEEEEKKTPPPVPSELLTREVEPPQAERAVNTEPSTEPATEPSAPAVDVAALSQQPVRYFFQTNNRRVMLVGDRLLSEGQSFDSYTVTRLEPNRIELEPADGKP